MALSDGQADPVDVAFFASHPNRVKKEAVANAAHSRDSRGNYNHHNNNSNYRNNKQNYRDDSRGQSSRRRDNQSSQHNYRGNHRGGRSIYTNRGYYICGLTNHCYAITVKPSTVTKEKMMRGEKPEATNFTKIATPNATSTTTTTTQRSRLQPYPTSVFSLSPATGTPTRVHHII